MHFVQTDTSIFLIQTYTFVIDSIANTCLFILVDGLKYISFLNILKIYIFLFELFDCCLYYKQFYSKICFIIMYYILIK